VPRLVSPSLHRSAGRAEFRLEPATAAIGQTLQAMGFERSEDALVRRFPETPDIHAIFARFTQHIDEMILQKRRQQAAPWQHALETVATRLTGNVGWWLAGSAALAIRGIESRPRDLDLVVDDARKAGALFEDLLIEPVTPMVGWVADWFGRAFGGALIEWVAGVHAQDSAAQREAVDWRGHTIFSNRLDIQLEVAEARGMHEQLALIHEHLARQG
jgi:hypothetical protein